MYSSEVVAVISYYILQITSAIVTYELVLIQFNQKEFQNAFVTGNI